MVEQGELFAGRYRVDQVLGTGGMGAVYRVLDERLHRQAALKVMNAGLSHDPTFRERFEREAKAAARLDHPNVVTVHHYDQHEDTLYLVMQYVEGRNLHRELADVGPLPVARAVDVVAQIAAGLDAAHRTGHVHRDVKPANVLLGRTDDGHERVLLTDFGLAQALADAGDDRLTSTGTMLGTATYGSPEQFRGEAASVRSDVYALACVTFEILTGQPPFRGATEVETAGHHLAQAPPDLAAVAPRLPVGLAAVLARGLAKDPYERPVSAGAFAAELAAAAGGPPGTAEPVPTGELPAFLPPPATNAPGHTGRLVALGAVVVAAAFGIGLAGGVLGGGGGSPTPSASSSAPAALIARLPPAVYRDCASQAAPGTGRSAAVRCTTPLAGVDELLVTQWESPTAMRADFAAAYGGKPDGKCGSYTGQPPSGLRSTWNGQQPLACYLNSNGAAVVLWEYGDQAVQVLAVRADGDAKAAFAWWLSAVTNPVT